MWLSGFERPERSSSNFLLSQKQIALLIEKIQIQSDTIGLHLKNIFKSGELLVKSTTEKSSVVQIEGKRKVTRDIDYFNPDVIFFVGYRIKSKRGTQKPEEAIESYTVIEVFLTCYFAKLR